MAPRTPARTTTTPRRKVGQTSNVPTTPLGRMVRTPRTAANAATPRTGRRKSFLRNQRETPQDMLRKLSRILVGPTAEERQIQSELAAAVRTPSGRRSRGHDVDTGRLASARRLVERYGGAGDREAGDRQSGTDSLFLSPSTRSRSRNGTVGWDSRSEMGGESAGPTPEGARRYVSDRRPSFGDLFRSGGGRMSERFDVTDFGVDGDVTANLSSLLDRLAEPVAKPLPVALDQADEDDETDDGLQRLDAQSDMDDTLHQTGLARPDERDDLMGAFQFTIPDHYDVGTEWPSNEGEDEQVNDDLDETEAADGDPGVDRQDREEDRTDNNDDLSRPAASTTSASGPMDLVSTTPVGRIMSPRADDSDLNQLNDIQTPEAMTPPPAQLDISPIPGFEAGSVLPLDQSWLDDRAGKDGNQTSRLSGRRSTVSELATGAKRPTVPKPVIKRLATTFLARSAAAGSGRLSAETVDALAVATDWFFEQAADDLGAYADHAGRKSIDDGDVGLLMVRQRVVGGRTGRTVFGLATEMLPRELVRLVRVDGAGKKKKQRKK